MEEKILVYKGTDKDMRCHGGFQYELGKTVTDDDAIRCCDHGFHSCEVPLNVLEYFPLQNGNRYFSGEAGGNVDRTGARDSKLASSELTLKAEIGLPGLIKAQMEYVRKKCENATEQNASGWRGNAAASGERGNAAASGERGAAIASGEYGSAAAIGKQCVAVAWGRNGKAMGAVGCWLVLSEYYPRKDKIKDTEMVKVDGKTIKPNVWYQLKNGEVAEAE